MTVPANVSTVILSEAKNLSIRGMRYFTSLRLFSMTNCVPCHFERSEKSPNSRNEILHFTALRSV